MPLAFRALLFWLLLFALAVANAALREYVLRPLFGTGAPSLSGVTLAALLAPAIYIFVRVHAPLAARAAWSIGGGWLVLTLLAETGLTMNAGRPAVEVLRALSWGSVAGGNLIVLPYAVVLLAPPLFARARRK